MGAPPFLAALRPHGDGFLLEVQVSPAAARGSFPDRFDAWRGRIGVRVQAPAEGDRANRELVTLVAAFFEVPASAVRVARGSRSPLKTVAVRGVDVAAARRQLEEARW